MWQYDAEGADVAVYPDGAWLGYWYDAGAIITVIARDEMTARRLVDSVDRIDGVDPNECPVDARGGRGADGLHRPTRSRSAATTRRTC